MSDEKDLPGPGLLKLGVGADGEMTVTDNEGNSAPLFPPGAREQICAALDDMNVTINEDGIDIHMYGACPMQGEGTVDGLPVYFRARGASWKLEISAEVDGDAVGVGFGEAPGWIMGADYGSWPDAGWITGAHARQCFMAAVASWRAAGGAKATQGEVPLAPRWPVPSGPDKPADEAADDV